MECPTRALPERDLHALLAVLLTVHGPLFADQLPEEVFQLLAHRLASDGLLPADSSKGEVNALLADLVQCLHWAMHPSSAKPYPDPLPREAAHDVTFPTGRTSAQAFVADAVALGGRPGRMHEIERGCWSVDVAFTELPPDQSFKERQTQLRALAERHGGRYDGHHH